MENEKIQELTEIIESLKGDAVAIEQKNNPDSELNSDYAVIGKITEPGRFNYWTAIK